SKRDGEDFRPRQPGCRREARGRARGDRALRHAARDVREQLSGRQPARQLRTHLRGLRWGDARLVARRAPRPFPRQRGAHLPHGVAMAAKPFSLGYVGIGLMGQPMTQRLASLGWSVRGYDIVPERSTVGSAAEAARNADVVLLNLPTNDAVKDAVFGRDGVASAVSGKQLVVDFSTIPVSECRSHAARLLAQTGCRWVDAP